MENSNYHQTTRRQFITKIAPVCALSCISSRCILSMKQAKAQQQVTHKFDMPLEMELTNRQFAMILTREKISLIKTMIKEMGEEKTIKILKRDTQENAFAMGQRQAKTTEKNDRAVNVEISMISGIKDKITPTSIQ